MESRATGSELDKDRIGASTKEVVLSVRGLSKTFPGVQALNGIDLDINRGEIHAILGQNGAGKSTLIRALSGAERPDRGSIFLRGRPVAFHNPQDAQRVGIFTIYQELSLIPTLSVAENIFVNDLPRGRLGIVDHKVMKRTAQEIVAWLGFAIDVDRTAGSLPIAQQQAVELAKALHRQAEVVLLDEPTSSLPKDDAKRLFALLRNLRSRGLALVYITHRLDEVAELCDRVTVFRDGRQIETRAAAETTRGAIVRMMLGRDHRSSILYEALNRARVRLGDGGSSEETALSVRRLSDGVAVHGISFDLHRGEVLGITGLVGNGQKELSELLFGVRSATNGVVAVHGKEARLRTPADAIRMGIGLLPEDRKVQGVVLGMAVDTNITMASLDSFSRLTVVDRARERRVSQRFVESLSMKVAHLGQPVQTLSGGTQQKVVLAKWLLSQAKILILAEPTRGIDIGAKQEIYELTRDYVQGGGSAIFITSELSEALMCDRVLVLARGSVVGELAHDEIDTEGNAIMELCR